MAFFKVTNKLFYPFIVAFNAVKRPRNKLLPVLAYVIAAVTCRSLTSVSYYSFEVNKTARHVTKKPRQTLVSVLKMSEDLTFQLDL